MSDGPNVKKLAVWKASLLTTEGESTAEGAFQATFKALTNRDTMTSIAKQAVDLVHAAILVVKSSPDNPYGDDDEAIADEIMRVIQEKKEHANKQEQS